MKPLSLFLIAISTMSLTACASTMQKLSNVGKQPAFNTVSNPRTRTDYKPLSWPLPDPEPAVARTSNSLWQPGSRAFFRDQRAARVGDILRVNVQITDQAKLDNKTDRQRNSTETAGITDIFGSPKVLGFIDPTLGATSTSQTNGNGKVDRKETISTQVAALVTQVLPNGNLVIEGSQEILVNYEIREVGVKGVIRPQDINSDNTVESNQIAEARITYSGRGQISDVEQPRWGQQVIDAVAPF